MKAFQASPGDSKYKENYKACKVCNSRNIYYDLYKPNSMFFLLKKHTVLSHKVFQSNIYTNIQYISTIEITNNIAFSSESTQRQILLCELDEYWV